MTLQRNAMSPSGAHATRRGFLGAAALAATSGAAVLSAPGARANPMAAEDFAYEVQRSEAEWRELLTDAEFHILREGGTETPQSSAWWQNEQAGTYHCKGCDLPLFTSRWQTFPGPGWVFFRQNIPASVLTGTDQTNPYTGSSEPVPDILALIEVHCRRCGSHLGHLLTINGTTLHCINGSALNFVPAEA